MTTLTRVFEFDSAHRVMNEKVKCFNLHGHRWRVELEFEYTATSALGYAVDFKEIKRIAGEFLDSMFDHATILNPLDEEIITLCQKNKWRMWLMGMGKEGDINPSAENLCHEILVVMDTLFTMERDQVAISKVKLYETPNCWVEEFSSSRFQGLQPTETFLLGVQAFRDKLGTFDYDIRNE